MEEKIKIQELYNQNPETEQKLQTDYNLSEEKDEEKKLFYCIVWTQLPLISTLFPFIGHTGITDSQGNIYDFAGSFQINQNNLAFGKVIKYVALNKSKEILDSEWDSNLRQGNQCYRQRQHNIFCDNCHSHVAKCLNLNQYQGKVNWNMLNIAFLCIFHSKYISYSACFYNYIFSILFYLIFIYIAIMPIQQ